MSVFISTTTPGCQGDYFWETAGPEGAIEVDNRTAFRLTTEMPSMFAVVEAPVKAVKKAAEKVEADIKAIEEVVVEEVEAVEAKVAPKKRTTAPKE